jgi:hypothetical protein
MANLLTTATKLYREGKGPFPVPLADRPTEPLTPEEKVQKPLLEDQQKMFLRGPSRIVLDVVPVQSTFRFLVIDRTWPTRRRDRWTNEPGTVEEPATLLNEKPPENFWAGYNELDKLVQKVIDDPDVMYDEYVMYDKHCPGLERHHAAINEALTGDQPYGLTNAPENLLKDESSP